MKTDLVVAGYIIHEGKILLIHHRKLDMWLPVGGHIDENETPDDALCREIREEIGIDVEILSNIAMPIEGGIKRTLANPFCVEVHSVIDHDHCCLNYICKALNPDKTKANDEIKDFRWFSRKDLDAQCVPVEVRTKCLKAFELLNQFTK